MTEPAAPARPFLTPGRIIALGLIAAVLVAVFSTGLKDSLTLEALAPNRVRLLAYVDAHAVLAVVLFMATYIAVTALSVPGAIWLSVGGGFLFGPLPAALYIVVAATIGATIIFILARYVLGDALRARTGSALEKMQAGFQADALSYLLVLRLVPLFPFFLVNLVPAFLGVRLSTFVVGTFFGIIPGAFVFATVGAGLGDALEAGAAVDPGAALRQPTVIGALAGLVVLSLIPMVYRRIKSRG